MPGQHAHKCSLSEDLIRCLSLPYTKGDNFNDFMLAATDKETLSKGFTPEGKNVLRVEQILSCKS